jgi:hypothetical protein
MQNFTALGITIHIQNRTKERDIERERKSTLIVDTIFRMPRLGEVHALKSDQIYVFFVMLFLFRYKQSKSKGHSQKLGRKNVLKIKVIQFYSFFASKSLLKNVTKI